MPKGGRREGAGRKSLGRIQTRFQLTKDEAELIKKLGGSAFLRTMLDGIKAGTLAIPDRKSVV